MIRRQAILTAGLLREQHLKISLQTGSALCAESARKISRKSNSIPLSGFFLSGLFAEEADDVEDDFHRLFHTFDRHEFQFAMEIVSAGKDVRARQAHE